VIAEPLRLVRYGIQSPTKQERQAFDCGTEALDRWLHTQAGQSERSHDAATYLLVRDREIVGYYALAAASISSASADPTLRKGAPAEIPAILLGRLAVASKEQGQGLGALLLREAVAASLQAGEVVGARLMLVDAIDDNAAAFYRRWGFRAGAGPARTLMARIADLQVSVPRTEPRTYHGIRVPEGWFDLGWGPFLPRPAVDLVVMIASAGEAAFEGSLDDIYAEFQPITRPIESLEGDASFSFPEPHDDPEEAEEQREMDEGARLRFERALQRADRPVPRTTRELAQLLVEIGFLRREIVGDIERWSCPEPLPLIEDLLPLEPDFQATLARHRWESLHAGSSYRVINHLIELGQPDSVTMTLEELSAQVALPVEEMREAIALLVSEGDFTTLSVTGEVENPDQLADASPFVLRVDWDLFAAQRISIVAAPPAEDDR
jgi:GNAT superfamily N-acetyltransferase